jgi:8-oxo-dGTP pyrophosphatase MutT (NUDIX family)
MSSSTNASCIVLSDAYVLFVVRLDGKLALPGGTVERGETDWKAMAREWSEETGMKLPKSKEVEFTKKIIRRHRDGTTTKIYVGVSKMHHRWFAFNRDGRLKRGETRNIEWMRVDEAIHSARVVDYVRASLILYKSYSS